MAEPGILFGNDQGILLATTRDFSWQYQGFSLDRIQDGNELFKEFKGALTEQYVLQQLRTIKGLNIYYWTAERGTAEVDFVIDNGKDVIPVEVKAEVNLQAKSLKVYREKFQPQLSIRTSMADYKKEDWLLNLPLWAVDSILRCEV